MDYFPYGKRLNDREACPYLPQRTLGKSENVKVTFGKGIGVEPCLLRR